MRSTGLGFETERERLPSKTTRPPVMPEEEGTCIDPGMTKKSKTTSQDNDEVVTISLTRVCMTCCAMLLPLLIGIGGGFGLGWYVHGIQDD